MTFQQSRYTRMQEKLQAGLQVLADATEDDLPRLESALIKLHGALEDFIRIEVARKVPELSLQVEDAKQTSWKELITYARDYLGFSDGDVAIISQANRRRLEVAHGGSYAGNITELRDYAKFVQIKAGQAGLIGTNDHGIENNYPAPEAPPPAPVRHSSGLGCFGRLILFGILFTICCVSLYFLWLAGSSEGLVEMFRQMDTAIPTSPSTFPRPSTSFGSTSVPVEVTTLSDTSTRCIIVWNEYEDNHLAGKNRSMVWDEIVASQVKGSGMTDRQFYDSVVERNPVLKTDGYEFKRAKSYYLPECE
jgi:hypothetical protein